MPFPLAHPAAVAPLRRYCPQFLNFPALIFGSLSPDIAYLSGPLHLDQFSHRPLGSIGFGLPVGMVMVWLFYGLRSLVVKNLPERHRQLVQPVSRQPAGSLSAIVLSVLIGVWTHLVWDSFTHQYGWLVQHLAFLRWPVAALMGHQWRVYEFLWYASSFFGVAWLCVLYQRWQQRLGAGSQVASGMAQWRNALLMAGLVLPIAAIHHLSRGILSLYLIAALTLTISIGAVWALGRAGARQ